MEILLIIIPLLMAAVLLIRQSYGMNETYKGMLENEKEIKRLQMSAAFENEIRKELKIKKNECKTRT
ncbi:hypothetical protein [Chryseobacterium sp.]|uniref:hypothetical protein n=1 Tax=Chryseobacterium sp. TaxID=1871047 RepID=UPI0028999079|nr:hypothetical protein [Chryseobacterium sp.]